MERQSEQDRISEMILKLSKLLITTALICWTIQEVALSAAALGRLKLNNGFNCTNHLQIIDRCSSLATYSYTTQFNQYPLNPKDMRVSCDRISEGLKCLKIHGKCLSNVARRSLTSYSNARSRHSKKLCSNLNDSRAADFVKSAECINKNKSKKDLMVASEKGLIASFQMLAINSTMKWEERFHQACCAAAEYKTRALKDIEPECLKFKPVVDEMMNSMIGELLDAVCPDHNSICAKLPKLILAKEWKAVSLTGAALDLIVALADNPKE